MIVKNFYKVVGVSALIGAGAVLSGCVPSVGFLSKNYTFDKSKNNGIAAINIVCNIRSGPTQLNIRRLRNDGTPYILEVYKTEFDCSSPKKPPEFRELRTMELPAGKYQIEGWDQYFGNLIATDSHFPALYFTIAPHQITYIGQLVMLGGEGERYKIGLINNAKADIPKIKRLLPNLATKKIRIQLAQVKK